MHSIDVGMSGSSSNTVTNGNPQKKLEDIWDRKPMVPSLSRMNSMECWDYTIELECLNGPQGWLFFFLFYNLIFPNENET